jgi:hypothetical protein
MPIIKKTYTELNINDKNDIEYYDDKLSFIYYTVLQINSDALRNQDEFDQKFLKIFVKPIIRSFKSLKNTGRNINKEKLIKISVYIYSNMSDNNITSRINQNLKNIINNIKYSNK